MANGVISRVKSALVGDMSAYENRSYEVKKSVKRIAVVPPQSSYGRIYHDPDVGVSSSKSKSTVLAPFGLPAKAWKKIRSIGEYDVARTR